MSARRGLVLAALLCACPAAAFAQRAGDNATTLAEDGFGGAVGSETTGIYTETDVRGFNPQQAGNLRVDDVYMDQMAVFVPRVKASSTIRVGFTALNYPSPAPSGIVAYRARQPGNVRIATPMVNPSPYGGFSAQIDAEGPIIRDRLTLAYGLYRGETRTWDGAASNGIGWGFIPLMKFGTLEIKPIASGAIFDADTRPLIVTTGPFLPPMIRRRIYLGQQWANNQNHSFNGGVLVRTALGHGLRFRGGVFRSELDRTRNYTEIYAVQSPTGASVHQFLSDPHQNAYAQTWEGVLAYQAVAGRVRHNITVGARGRERRVESGGSQFFNYGAAQLGVPDPEARPVFTFTPVNVATLRQTNVSLGYAGVLQGRGQINLGVTRSWYSAQVRSRTGVTGSSADPWLYNAAVLVTPSRRFSVFAGYVSGLEDSGVAPENAANRNEQLPASPTSQIDGGIRIAFRRMSVVASVFEIKKPYFSFDAGGRYTDVGDLRQRGLEISATGDVGRRLHLVGGALLADPVVSGPAVSQGVIGPRPVGLPQVRIRLDASYRTDLFHGLTLTAAAVQEGRRAASAAPYAQLGGRQLELPSHPTLDLGVRHAFKVDGKPVSIRLVIQNVFDDRAWKVVTSNTFQLDEARRLNLFLMADF